MDSELQHNGKTCRCIDNAWYDTTTHIRAPLVIACELDARLRSLSAADKRIGETRASTLTEGNEDNTFYHIDTIPIIADIIREHCGENNDYITHHEIVTTFLVHPIAQQTVTQQGNPIEQVASNIIAWFSKRFTEDATLYQDEFERERINGRWSYRTLTKGS